MLEMMGYQVELAFDLAQGRAALKRSRPDLIVLDVLLPDGSGLDFMESLRKNADETPILLLTALAQVEDEVKGLRLGGDDYLTKPYDFDVLAARIEGLLRRTAKGKERLLIENLVLDRLSGRGFYMGEDMNLAQKEFALLLLFAENVSVLMTPEYLYQTIWGRPMLDDDSALKSAISRLRKKLGSSGYSITAYRGEGYKFEAVG
jgi:DNA-binding response OmpR family regulator